MLVNGQKFPIVADITKIMIKAGFRYRDRIVWVKPRGTQGSAGGAAWYCNIHIQCTSTQTTYRGAY